MKWLVCGCCVVLSSLSCSGDDDAITRSDAGPTAGGDAGSGNSGGGGAAAGSGGAAAGAGGASAAAGASGAEGDAGNVQQCVLLQSDLNIHIIEGQRCDPTVDAAAQCSGTTIIKDFCGCDVPMNDNYAEIDEARAVSERFLSECGTPGCGGAICTTGDSAVCDDPGDFSGDRCRWAI